MFPSFFMKSFSYRWYFIFFLTAAFVSFISWKQGSFSCSSLIPSVGSKTSSSNLCIITQSPLFKKIIPSSKNLLLSLQKNPQIPSPLDRLSEEEEILFPGASVVEGTEIEGTEPGQKVRLRILKTHFKYPFIRTEEVIDETTHSLVLREEMVASHFLVRLPEGKQPEAFLKEYGPEAVSITPVSSSSPLYRLQLASASLRSLPEGLEKSSSLSTSFSEPDFIVHPNAAPNNPFFLTHQWAFWESHINPHDLNGSTQTYPGINVQQAWSIRSDASSIVVAVVDSGIRYTHEGLASNIWHNPSPSEAGDIYGWNSFNNNGDPMDTYGHGTHCAGSIGAVGNNNTGTVGVAWKVQLMACKYYSSLEGGTTSDLVTCLDYAITHGAHIINCSFGCMVFSIAEKEALERAEQAGIIVVASAGNDARNNDFFPTYPSSYGLDNIVSVASLSVTGELAADSNYGLRMVDLAAPGDSIYSTWGGPSLSSTYYIVDGTGNTSYAWMRGTSCSAPLVTGAFALLKAHFPNESYLELIKRLFKATDKIPSLKEKTTTGGCLNVGKALSNQALN